MNSTEKEAVLHCLLERGDETVTLRQLVERFEAVEEEYNGVPWTLKQIYTQIDMLVSEKPCGDCIRRSDIGLTDFEIVMCNGDYKEGLKMLLDKIEKAPSVHPAPKIGHWIKCIDDNGSSYYLCSVCRCGEDYNFDFCPNCGSDNGGAE